jgi:hypothetical protein
MKNVLFIAYLFPPRGGGGVQRTVKFVKYLPQFGWQPSVLTAPVRSGIQDLSLAAEVPPRTAVVRVRGLVLSHRIPWRLRRWMTRWVFTVDEQIGWLPFAIRRGSDLLRSGSWHTLYSTSGPYTDHLVALGLKRRTKLAWVADFRDPWLGNFATSFATPLHRRLCEHLERKIVTTAERVC